MAYNATTKGYTITVSGTVGTRSQTFLPANINAAQGTAADTVYLITKGSTTDSLVLTKPGTSGTLTYQYVGSGYWQRTIQASSTSLSGTLDSFVYGYPTLNAAVPRTGQAQYTLDLLGSDISASASGATGVYGTGGLAVDLATGDIIIGANLTLPSLGNTTQILSYSGQGKLSSSSNSFTGSFGTGTFTGAFYGPAAQEVGGTFYINQGSSTTLSGTLMGRGGPETTLNTTLTNQTVAQFYNGDLSVSSALGTGYTEGQNRTGTFKNASTTQSGVVVFGNTLLTALPLDYATRTEVIGAADGTTQQSSFTTIGSGYYGSGVATGPSISDLPTLSYVGAGRETYEGPAPAGGAGNQFQFADYTYGIETPSSAMPRTGQASFEVAANGVVADPGYANLVYFHGLGNLTANFATGTVTASGTLNYLEDVYVNEGTAFPPSTGTFSLTATNSSTNNTFAGSFNFTGIGPYSGPLKGRYYGPAAQEIGATFTATSTGGGVASGSIIGALGSVPLPPPPPPPPPPLNMPGLASLTSPISFTNTNLSYTPATGTYTFTSPDASSPYPTQTTLTTTFNPSNIDSINSTSAYAIYYVNNSKETTSIVLLNTGQLTYTSFADIKILQNAGGYNALSNYPIFYGLITPYLYVPTTGTANRAYPLKPDTHQI